MNTDMDTDMDPDMHCRAGVGGGVRQPGDGGCDSLGVGGATAWEGGCDRHPRLTPVSAPAL